MPTIPTSPPIPPTPTNSVNQVFTCPIPNGLFPDPKSTSNFYNCGSNIANLMPCGSGMIWNNPKQWCDFPENVQTVVQPITVPITVAPTTVAAPITVASTTVAAPTVAPTTVAVPTTKAPTTVAAPTVATTTVTVPTVPVVATTQSVNQPFQCPADGLFPDPANCFKYYSCGNGIAYSMNCNDNLKWNKVGQYCDHAYNVQC